MREAHFQKLEEACYLLLQQQRAKGALASGPCSATRESSSEIVAQVSGEADNESEEEADPTPTVSHAKAHEAFGIALQWLEAQGTDSAHVLSS